jgi:3-phenylpropionate/trans-cinnamate dioxygenase ferredoxin component
MIIQMEAIGPLQAGERALAAGRWVEAREAFAAALVEDESPAALLGLADALWWLADTAGCVAAMERAYALLRRAGDVTEAALTAVWLAIIQQKVLGNPTACSGWAARAARLAADSGDDPARGWVLLARTYEAADPEQAVASAREALDIARAAGDTDLELCTLGELEADAPRRVEVGGVPVSVVRTEGEVFAVHDICSHANVSLSEGEVEDCMIECWLHGSMFDLRTGKPSGLPATRPIPVYPVKIEGDGPDAAVLVSVTQES